VYHLWAGYVVLWKINFMPDDRPMPLTGEERIEPHPVLGEHQDNFPSRRWPPLVIAWSFLIGISLVWNIATWNIDTSDYGPFIAAVFGVIALGVGWWVMHLWNREVIFYKHGFTYREGSKDVPFRYDELETIRLRAERLAYFGGLFHRDIYRITLKTVAGDVIRLNNIYQRIHQLGDGLNQVVCDRRRGDIQDALLNSESVPFADELQVSYAGITVDASALDSATDDAHLPWNDFRGYKIAHRQIHLLTADGRVWYSLPLAKVDNLLLLVELLKDRQASGEVLP
jgi:hypothetical protein